VAAWSAIADHHSAGPVLALIADDGVRASNAGTVALLAFFVKSCCKRSLVDPAEKSPVLPERPS
jgi:hypothetical protein